MITHYGATNAASDAITVLHAARLLVKTWCTDGSIKPYDKAKNYHVEQRRVADIRELSKLLTELESNPHACIIRGRFVGLEAARKLEQLDHPDKAFRKNSLFDDQPLHAILIEVDDFEPIADAVRDPKAAIEEYITACLPDEFQGVSYHWQLSNSAGRADKQRVLKAHIWFWLRTPYTSAQAKAWTGAIGLKADASVFQKIQIHYTGAPVFEGGVADPVPVRSGFVDGLVDNSVDLKIDTALAEAIKPEPVTRAAKIDQAQHNDPIAQFLIEHNYFKSAGADGRFNIVCPFADEHTGDSGDSATSYFPAHTGGFEHGHFKCLHAHCLDRSDAQFRSMLGINTAADDFEVLPADSPVTGGSRYAFSTCETFLRRERQTYIVRDVLPAATLAVIYGESGSGKTFFALDLACAVARGEAWRGKRVHQGAVVYIAAEDATGVRDRIEAYIKHHKIEPSMLPLWALDAAPNFMTKEDTKDVLAAVRVCGTVSVIVIDTWAQVTPGANENSGEDMGKAMAACRWLSRAMSALVVLVHHSGKDATKGARGWSGLRAAADAEIEITRYNGDSRVARITKMKGGQDGTEFGFKLQPVLIGQDEDGEDITSCVLEHGTALPKKQRGEREPKGAVQQIVMRVIRDLTIGGPATSADVIEAAVSKMAAFDPSKSKRDTRRQRVIQAIDALVGQGLLGADGGSVNIADGAE